MSFWTAVVIIVAIGCLSEMYRSYLKATSKKMEESSNALEERMAELEKRMANIETIVIRRGREDEWESLRD